MAHADYNCCAVCDCKLDYNAYDAETKEEICTDCLHALRDVGLNILDVEEMIKWIDSEKNEEVHRTLKKVGFHFCYYPNEVDYNVREKLEIKREIIGEDLQ